MTTPQIDVCEYAHKNGIQMWILVPRTEATPAEIAQGVAVSYCGSPGLVPYAQEDRSNGRFQGGHPKDLFNRWNPQLVEAGYPSPI